MNYKFLSIALGSAFILLAVFVGVLAIKPIGFSSNLAEYNQVNSNKVNIPAPSPQSVNTNIIPTPTQLVSTSTPSDISSQYLDSKYRVIGIFQKQNQVDTDYAKRTRQVQLVVVTDRGSDGNNDSQCGSLYTQPNCYFFIEPLYVHGAPKQAEYLGALNRQGAFIPDSVKFIDPDTVEFQTSDGDAGWGFTATWHLNLETGKFEKISYKEFNPN